MIELASHKLRWRWLFTLIALVVLLIAGVIVSLLVSSTDLPSHQFNERGLLIWRLIAYSLLAGLWPYLIQHLLKRIKIKATQIPSRMPLAVLIVLYELLIVQNPLQALLGLGSAW
ncbi:MAG: hypothetical protein OQK12_00695 [Motiliproteus sp.]|nr:hypothetical protein [Motiliproteus sp.]MCW9050908.1 hypothetical protein [Motiliproteus sp.]